MKKRCPKGMSMGPNGVCTSSSMGGGIKPHPGAREECTGRCDILQSDMMSCYTNQPGPNCECIELSGYDPSGLAGMLNFGFAPQYQCFYTGENPGTCYHSCFNWGGGRSGGRAAPPGWGGPGSGRWAKGGRIKRASRKRRRR